eukprot:6192065-Pleurochrysis_carterae.AAC.1
MVDAAAVVRTEEKEVTAASWCTLCKLLGSSALRCPVCASDGCSDEAASVVVDPLRVVLAHLGARATSLRTHAALIEDAVAVVHRAAVAEAVVC